MDYTLKITLKPRTVHSEYKITEQDLKHLEQYLSKFAKVVKKPRAKKQKESKIELLEYKAPSKKKAVLK